MSVQIAFNTANLVAQYSGYRFSLAKWMDQHTLTVQHTDLNEWRKNCEAIAAAGFTAVEVWVAHVEKCQGDDARSQEFLRVLHECGLAPVALAGPLNEKTADICGRLGIPAVCGGYWGSDKALSAKLSRERGIRFNYENHPEKSIPEIREKIDAGANGFAVALDTGWCATGGIDSVMAVRELGRLIRHVHLKDVAAMGGHATVKLGTGVVNIQGVIAELKAVGFDGVLSWEDEPEDRNPFEIAAEMHRYISQQWSK